MRTECRVHAAGWRRVCLLFVCGVDTIGLWAWVGWLNMNRYKGKH
ncbi:MAG: hypothetical protein JWO71_2271 [Candidatus Acidoferrum typicum]|nr:hypothetical protein [Candidatus Acidoferrum typicum]